MLSDDSSPSPRMRRDTIGAGRRSEDMPPAPIDNFSAESRPHQCPAIAHVSETPLQQLPASSEEHEAVDAGTAAAVENASNNSIAPPSPREEAPQAFSVFDAPAPTKRWLQLRLFILFLTVLTGVVFIPSATLTFRSPRGTLYAAETSDLTLLTNLGFTLQCPSDGASVPCEEAFNGEERNRIGGPHSPSSKANSAPTPVDLLFSFFHFDSDEDEKYARYVPCQTLLTNMRPASSTAAAASGAPDKRVYSVCDLATSDPLSRYAFDVTHRYAGKNPESQLASSWGSMTPWMGSWEDSPGAVNCTVAPPLRSLHAAPVVEDEAGHAWASAQWLPMAGQPPAYRANVEGQPWVVVGLHSDNNHDAVSFTYAFTCTGRSPHGRGDSLVYRRMANLTDCTLGRSALSALLNESDPARVTAARILADASATERRYETHLPGCRYVLSTCLSSSSSSLAPPRNGTNREVAAVFDVASGALTHCRAASNENVDSASNVVKKDGLVILCADSVYEQNYQRLVLQFTTALNVSYDLQFTSAKCSGSRDPITAEPVYVERPIGPSFICFLIGECVLGLCAIIIVLVMVLQWRHPRALMRLSAALELRELAFRRALTSKDKADRAKRRAERHQRHEEKKDVLAREPLVHHLHSLYNGGGEFLPGATAIAPPLQRSPVSPLSSTTSTSWTFSSATTTTTVAGGSGGDEDTQCLGPSVPFLYAAAHRETCIRSSSAAGDEEGADSGGAGKRDVRVPLINPAYSGGSDRCSDGTKSGSPEASQGRRKRSTERLPVLFRAYPERRRRQRNPFPYGRGCYLPDDGASGGEQHCVIAVDDEEGAASTVERGSEAAGSPAAAAAGVVVTEECKSDPDAVALPLTREEQEAVAESCDDSDGDAAGDVLVATCGSADRLHGRRTLSRQPAAASAQQRQDKDFVEMSEGHAPLLREDGQRPSLSSEGREGSRRIASFEREERDGKSSNGHSNPRSVVQTQLRRAGARAGGETAHCETSEPRQKSKKRYDKLAVSELRIEAGEKLRGIPLESRTARYVTSVTYVPAEEAVAGEAEGEHRHRQAGVGSSSSDGTNNGNHNISTNSAESDSNGRRAHSENRRGSNNSSSSNNNSHNDQHTTTTTTTIPSALHPLLVLRIAHVRCILGLFIALIVLSGVALIFFMVSFAIVLSAVEDFQLGAVGGNWQGYAYTLHAYADMNPTPSYLVFTCLGLLSLCLLLVASTVGLVKKDS